MSLVAIVGRPNVGKSTLFNRLVGMRKAIVDETAGVTRDRHYGKCDWNGREFSVVDTGGWTTKSDDVFEEAIRKQVVIAIEEADLVLFMVEAATGITDYDSEIADLLRRSGKPVVLCVNKVDSGEKVFDTYQFYALGLGEIWSISAANGSGTGDLLDEIIRLLPDNAAAEDDDHQGELRLGAADAELVTYGVHDGKADGVGGHGAGEHGGQHHADEQDAEIGELEVAPGEAADAGGHLGGERGAAEAGGQDDHAGDGDGVCVADAAEDGFGFCAAGQDQQRGGGARGYAQRQLAEQEAGQHSYEQSYADAHLKSHVLFLPNT